MIETGTSDEVSVPTAEWEAMKERLAALERLAYERTPSAIEGEVARTARVGEPGRSSSQGPERTDRRGLLKQGAVLAAGAVTGGVALVAAQAAPAAAATGAMQYGASNNAGNAETTLTSTDIDATLALDNSNGLGLWVTNGGARIDQSGGGYGLTVNSAPGDSGGATVTNNSSTGYGVVAGNMDSTNTQAAVYGITHGNAPGVLGTSLVGPGVMGTSTTTSPAVWGSSTGPGLYATAVRGTTSGLGTGVAGASGQGNGVFGSSTSGSGVNGTSTSGRGGHFSGGAAQIQLSPGSASTHPTSGATGDLYLDSSARLWLCTAGGTTATWKQVQVA